MMYLISDIKALSLTIRESVSFELLICRTPAFYSPASLQNAFLNNHNNRINGAFNTGSSRKDTLKKTTISSSVDITPFLPVTMRRKMPRDGYEMLPLFQFYPHSCNDRGFRSYKMHKMS